MNENTKTADEVEVEVVTDEPKEAKKSLRRRAGEWLIRSDEARANKPAGKVNGKKIVKGVLAAGAMVGVYALGKALLGHDAEADEPLELPEPEVEADIQDVEWTDVTDELKEELV